jgi:hypothetical protein
MFDTTTGFVVGGQGTVKKTTNGGEFWDTLAAPFPWIITLNAVTFLDENTVFILGAQGTIFRSTDQGVSWDSIPSGVTSNLYSIHFIDNTIGWISGAGGTILKTTDSGNSWNPQTSGTSFALFSVHFSDADNGWAVGPQATLLNTTDGGNNWQPMSIFSRGSLEEVFFVTPQIGWIVGDAGLIIKTTSGGGGPVAVNGRTNQLPDEFYLSQNYPNPFNPVTKIIYTIPNVETRNTSSLQRVTLKIYDILGNELTTLVNENKPAGKYEVEFNGSSLSSGVYFYKIQAGPFRQVKKMILLR